MNFFYLFLVLAIGLSIAWRVVRSNRIKLFRNVIQKEDVKKLNDNEYKSYSRLRLWQKVFHVLAIIVWILTVIQFISVQGNVTGYPF